MILEEFEVCNHIDCLYLKKGKICSGKEKNRGYKYLCGYIHKNIELIKERCLIK